MALALSQGAAAAAILVSNVFGDGSGADLPKFPSEDDLPEALKPLFGAFERFVAAGGPNDLNVFINNFFGGDPYGSPTREHRMTAGVEKGMREAFEKFSDQQRRMIRAAEEPPLFQVATLLIC